MDMKIVLGALLILGFLTIGTASAYELVDFKAAYRTPDGLAQLKGGTIEWGDWQVWKINDYIDDKSTVIVVNDEEYTIFYRALGFSVPKITGVEKVVIDTEPVFPNETVENETIVPETPAQGESYMSPVGLLKLKSGSIESGEYEVWNASDYKYIFTHNLELEGVNYTIKCAICDPDGGKIVGVETSNAFD